MTLRRILVALVVLAVAGVVGWQFNARRQGSSIVVRYAEPPARGTGRLGLISCGLRVEDATGKVIARRDVPASPKGGTVRSVRIDLTRNQISRAQRVLADCTDAAGRTSEAASYALAPTRPLTRMASQQR
jgi:hypothetical protein